MSKPQNEPDGIGAVPTDGDESTRPLLEIEALARDVFETSAEAADWMRLPQPMLDGQTPHQAALSIAGAQRAKAILVAIKYGGVA